jgi:hypothetical protein
MTNHSPVAIKVATAQATEMRKRLEASILQQLQAFQDATGLRPTRIELDTLQVSRIGTSTDAAMLDRVRGAVEV